MRLRQGPAVRRYPLRLKRHPDVDPRDVLVRLSVGNCLLILRRYCGKEFRQLAQVEMSVRGKLPQGEVQHAQTIETGTGRATAVQLPVEFNLCCFLGRNIERSDWRPVIEVHLHDRDYEDPRDVPSSARALTARISTPPAETRV